MGTRPGAWAGVPVSTSSQPVPQLFRVTCSLIKGECMPSPSVANDRNAIGAKQWRLGPWLSIRRLSWQAVLCAAQIGARSVGPACSPRVASVLRLSHQGWQMAHRTSRLASYEVIPVSFATRKLEGLLPLAHGDHKPREEAWHSRPAAEWAWHRVGTRGSLREVWVLLPVMKQTQEVPAIPPRGGALWTWSGAAGRGPSLVDHR